ncbi:MAG: glycosyltransferase family 2 protein [Desulfovibrio sp.]|nr:glycosyltransferase family 2 protein [Desulfovibrio sp.]
MISIVMPVYNAAPWLAASLDSILEQDMPDWECICVNDGSRDASADIVRTYAARDSRIHLLHRDANCGAGSARNWGIAQARGEYICFMDPDDSLPPDSLSIRLSTLLACGTDAVRAGYTIVDKDRTTLKLPCIGLYPEVYPSGHAIGDHSADAFFFHMLGDHCCFLFRRAQLINNRILYGTQYNFNEDVLFLIKAFFSIKKVSFIGESVYLYNQVNTDSLSRKNMSIDRLHAIFYMMHICYALAQDYKIRYADSAFIHYMQFWLFMSYNSLAKGDISVAEIESAHEQLFDMNRLFAIYSRLAQENPDIIILKPVQDWLIRLLGLLQTGRKDAALQLAISVGRVSLQHGLAGW